MLSTLRTILLPSPVAFPGKNNRNCFNLILLLFLVLVCGCNNIKYAEKNIDVNPDVQIENPPPQPGRGKLAFHRRSEIADVDTSFLGESPSSKRLRRPFARSPGEIRFCRSRKTARDRPRRSEMFSRRRRSIERQRRFYYRDRYGRGILKGRLSGWKSGRRYAG